VRYDYWQQLPAGRLVLGGNRDASLETEETDVEETIRLYRDGSMRSRRNCGFTPEVTDRCRDLGTTPDPGAARLARFATACGSRAAIRARQRAGLAAETRRARDRRRAAPELEIFAPSRLTAA